MQSTLRNAIRLAGIGLHTGRPARIRVLPASANFGIWFRRTDVRGKDDLIAARYDCVTDTRLCTVVSNEDGVTVSTIEHLMAALAGCGVHNALIEIDGPEVPILDGSSAGFVRRIMEAGLQDLSEPVRIFRIRQTVEVRRDDAIARIEPAAAFGIDFRISFDDAAIGEQSLQLDLSNGAFVRELCDSRTFCRHADVEALRAAGLALGGSLDNAVVVEGPEVLTPGGMRHRDECVRHKMLDALGDLALAGAPVLGRYTGIKAGHALTNQLVRTLFATPGAVEVAEADEAVRRRLPGAGLRASDLAAVA